MKSRDLITNYRELPYNPLLKERAAQMRNESTKGEIKFWCELLRKKQTGFTFYRQKPIYHYIVDFYCAKLKLVIEIDGTSHLDKQEYDKNRDRILVSMNLKVLHYNDLDVLNNFHLVEYDFMKQIEQRKRDLRIE